MVRVVAQRVSSASVTVGGQTIAGIGTGLALLVGVRRGDDEQAAERVADKVAVLRVFEDANGKMNLSCREAGGDMLAVSQFTLYGDARKGRRPSFIEAEDPVPAEALFQHFVQRLESHGYSVAQGIFGAHMLVSIENDGPVTILLDSEEL